MNKENSSSPTERTSRPKGAVPTTAVLAVVTAAVIEAATWIAAGSTGSTVRLAALEPIAPAKVVPTAQAAPVVPTTTTTLSAPPTTTTTDSVAPPGTSAGTAIAPTQLPLEHVPTTVAAPPRSTPATPPEPPPTPVVEVDGSVVLMDDSTSHGCKAWMDSRTPGPYAQGLIQSWGDDCEMSLQRSTDAGKTFSIESGKHRLSTGTDTTYFYWAGPGYLIKVCLTDFTISKTTCSKPFGG